jgi:hypothetical protein
LSLSHCSKFDDPCVQEKDCEGGNDNDVEACVELARGLENVADAYDCGDPFDKYTDCLKQKATCRDVGGGKKSYGAGDACKAEQEASSTCIAANSGKGKK